MIWAALLFVAPAAPFLLAMAAAARPVRAILPVLLPLAPLPALAVALFAPDGAAAPLPDVLLGAGLIVDPVRRVFMGAAALLWCLAGFYALGYMGPRRRGWFGAFWLVTLTGNVGVFLAADAVSFYVAFSLLSLSAFGLVVHQGDGEARRAARIYLILAMAGETALLAGLILGATAAHSIMIPDIRRALPAAPLGDLGLLLLVAGLGLKAGLMPLHVWLPLAHPAAPAPASAVLSGAIVKAGVFGLLVFLPLESVAPAWSDGLVFVGLATAYLGVLLGLPQARVKTTLAYSTISQMGLLAAVIGAALAGPGAAGIGPAAALYATHHGLAKGALFLATGLVSRAGRASRRLVLALAGLAALAVAGLPVTGGALAKLAVKGPLGEVPAAALVTLSAVGTTVLMLRALQLLARTSAGDEPAPRAMTFAYVAAVAAAFAVPWLIYPELAGRSWTYPFSPTNLWAAAWPVLGGFAVWSLARRLPTAWIRVPEGDLVVPAERLAAAVARAWGALGQRVRRPQIRPSLEGVHRGLAAAEARLAAWPAASGVLLAAILAAFALLAGR